MVKSVSSCCVRGRWVLSNPVTIDEISAKSLTCLETVGPNYSILGCQIEHGRSVIIK